LKTEDDRISSEELPANIAKEVAREKSIRHGSPASLHRWWARRPPILARIATYLALTDKQTPEPDFLEALGEVNPKPSIISSATMRIRDNQWRLAWTDGQYELDDELELSEPAIPGTPRVLDPFAGGGSIPLEAARLGCHAYASDLSPIAYHILRATLEYPAAYGQSNANIAGSASNRTWAGLAEELSYWARRVDSQVAPRLLPLFPGTQDEVTFRHTYLWFHIVTCPSPACGAEVPLQQSLRLTIDGLTVTFKQVDGVLTPEIVNGLVPVTKEQRERGIVCPSCNTTFSNDGCPTKRQILAVLVRGKGINKSFTVIKRAEANVFAPWNDEHAQRLGELLEQAFAAKLHTPLPSQTYSPVIKQGYRNFAELFSQRQLLVALEYLDAIRSTCLEMVSDNIPQERVGALMTYLGFFLGYLVDRNSILCKWMYSPEHSGTSFFSVSVAFARAYTEIAPFGLMERWLSKVIPAIENSALIPAASGVTLADASSLPYEDDYFDAIVTDPPFYDRVPYSDLSDFYWVWESGAFGTPDPTLTLPDLSEVIQSRGDDFAERYREGLLAALREANRVLRHGRLFTMILTAKTRTSFDEYVTLAQRAGFELFNVRSFQEEWGRALAFDTATSTFLIYFRKPLNKPVRGSLRANASTLLEDVEKGKPVLYEGLADLLLKELDKEIVKGLIPPGARGTEPEQLLEVLANDDLRTLLGDLLGKNGIRKIANQLALLDEDGSSVGTLDAILMHFGFSLPSINSEDGITQTLQKLHQMQAKIKLTRDKTTVRAALLDGCTAIERLLRMSIWGWAQKVYGTDRDNVLLGILNSKEQRVHTLERLSFGHLLVLFRDLPEVITRSPKASLISQKFGRAHIYLPTNRKTKLAERLEAIITLRNKLVHDKDNYYSDTPLNDLREVVDQTLDNAKQLILDMVENHALPRLAQAIQEIKDFYGRITYKFLLDDSTEVEAHMSSPIKLGATYLYFGSETNPRPVDPLMLLFEELGNFT
jgi:hypothetical protein